MPILSIPLLLAGCTDPEPYEIAQPALTETVTITPSLGGNAKVEQEKPEEVAESLQTNFPNNAPIKFYWDGGHGPICSSSVTIPGRVNWSFRCDNDEIPVTTEVVAKDNACENKGLTYGVGRIVSGIQTLCVSADLTSLISEQQLTDAVATFLNIPEVEN